MKNTPVWLVIVVSLLAGFFIGQELFKRNVWTGIYYPDLDVIDDQRTWVVSPPLYSIEECREWVDVVHRSGDNYDYSCGQGCRFRVNTAPVLVTPY